MNRQDPERLVRLAQDRSPEGRKVLAATINDLFATQESEMSERELALVNDILEKLLRTFEIAVRRELAERLALREKAPHDVIVALANDEIEVARPVLLHSPILLDGELIDVVRARSRQHQMAIAMRTTVSEAVSEALVEAGDVDVVTSLLHNRNASIAEATMRYLVEESRRVDSYQEPLVLREDLSSDLAERIYGWVTDSLRAHILDRFELDPAVLDESLEELPADLTEADTAARPAHATVSAVGWRQVSASERLAHILAESREITPELLIQILRDGKIDLFEAMFAEWTKLEPPYLQEVLYQCDGKTFAIACRALGVTKKRFIQLHLLMQTSKTQSPIGDPQELGRVVGYFDRITTNAARDVLQRWQDLSHDAGAVQAAGHGG